MRNLHRHRALQTPFLLSNQLRNAASCASLSGTATAGARTRNARFGSICEERAGMQSISGLRDWICWNLCVEEKICRNVPKNTKQLSEKQLGSGRVTRIAGQLISSLVPRLWPAPHPLSVTEQSEAAVEAASVAGGWACGNDRLQHLWQNKLVALFWSILHVHRFYAPFSWAKFEVLFAVLCCFNIF